MDALKQDIADAVHNGVRLATQAVPIPDERIEVNRLTPLETSIRVASGDQRGPRYFNVRISERT